MAFWNDEIEMVKSTLEIDEAIDFHKKGWKFQRIGLLLVLCVVALSAIGMFGNGIVSERSLHDHSTTVEYERYSRFQAPMTLRFQMTSTASHIISFPNEYLARFDVQRIVPEPTSTSIKDGRVRYTFEGNGELAVSMYMEPEQAGPVTATIIADDHSFLIHHFIFP